MSLPMSKRKAIITIVTIIVFLFTFANVGFAQLSYTEKIWDHGSSYNILAVASLPNGNIFMGGESGKFQIITPLGESVYSGTWSKGSCNITTAIAFPGGNIFIGGNYQSSITTGASWEVRKSDGSLVASGNLANTTQVYDSDLLPNGNVICATHSRSGGSDWYIFNSTGQVIMSSASHISTLRSVAALSNGNFVIGDAYGGWKIMNLNTTLKEGAVDTALGNILELSNGNIFMAWLFNDGLRFQIINQSGETVYSDPVGYSTGGYLKCCYLEGNLILAATRYKAYIITNSGNFLDPISYSLNEVCDVSQAKNGNIVIVGTYGRFVVCDNVSSSLSISSYGTNQVSFSINNNGKTTNSTYYVQRSDDSGFTQNVVPVRNWVSGTIFNDTGLTPNKTYYYRVKAKTSGGIETFYSPVVSFTTLAATPTLSIGIPTASSLPITLSSSNNTGTQYFVQRATDSAFTQNVVTELNWSTSTSYTSSGLASGTAYYYRVKARNSDGKETSYSPVVSKTTLPSAVTGLIQSTSVKTWGNPNGRIRVVLNWNKPKGATGYLIKIHDGYTWRTFTINNGDITTWDSSTEKIYPSETILDGYSTGARTIDLFNYSKGGLDLSDDPRNLYRSAQGSPYTNTQYYMFDVQAYGVNGTSLPSEHSYINSTVTSALDNEGPTGSIEVLSKDGLKKTSSTSVILNVTGSDSKSGLAGVRYSNNATTWSELEPLSSPKEWETSTGAGTKTVYMKLIDNVGNETILSDDIYLVDDITGPTVTLGIANGASYITSKIVDLVITAYDNFSRINELKMRFSNNGYLWSAWEPFSDIKENWDITNAAYGGTDSAGTKSIYVQVLDAAQNTGLARADIGYSTQTPTGTVSLNMGIPGTFNGEEVRFVSNANINLSLNFSNVTEMRVSMDGVSYSPWIPYESTLPITLPKGDGLTVVGVQVRNINKVISDTIKYKVVMDTTPPNIFVKTSNGATATKTGSIELTILVTDNISIDSFKYKINDGSWNSLPSNGKITVSGLAKGFHQIQVSVMDQAGNISKQTINVWSL